MRQIRFQWVTAALIAINIAVFLFINSGVSQRAVLSFALVPVELFDEWPFARSGDPRIYSEIEVRELWTLLSYQFMHVDLLHLFGNMLFLWIFGDNVEDDLGHARYLVFVLLCGAIAGIAHALITPEPQAPLIGASGAVAGIVTAYVILHPRVRLWVLLFKFLPISLSALVALGMWILLQFAMPFLAANAQVAWWAHIGGIFAGAILIVLLRPPGVPLLGDYDRTT